MKTQRHVNTSKNLHRFHALIARRWMLGLPLPQIIDEQISRNAAKPVRTTIRNTLDLIEGDIRFQAVRLFGCYSAHRQRTGLLRSERVGASSHAGHVFGSSERATELFDKAQSPVRGIEP